MVLRQAVERTGQLELTDVVEKKNGDEPLADVGFEVLDLGPGWDEAGPFLGTAAVIQNLDLMIPSDMAVAHLAGSLGAPVWLALSSHIAWRWGVERDDSPWTKKRCQRRRGGEEKVSGVNGTSWICKFMRLNGVWLRAGGW